MSKITLGRLNGKAVYLGQEPEKKFKFPDSPFDFVGKFKLKENMTCIANLGEEIDINILEKGDVFINSEANVLHEKNSLPNVKNIKVKKCICKKKNASNMLNITFATHVDDKELVFILTGKEMTYRHEESKVYQKWTKQNFISEEDYNEIKFFVDKLWSVNEIVSFVTKDTVLHSKLCEEIQNACTKAPFIYENVQIDSIIK